MQSVKDIYQIFSRLALRAQSESQKNKVTVMLSDSISFTHSIHLNPYINSSPPLGGKETNNFAEEINLFFSLFWLIELVDEPRRRESDEENFSKGAW